MKKVLVATEKPFAPAAIKKIESILKKAGSQLVLCEKYPDKSTLLKAVAEVDALIVRSDKIDEEVLNAAKNLKIVVRAGAGYDNVDCQVASEKGIVVMNTPGQNANAVAELAVGLAIYGIREFFSGKAGGELRKRTLGLHGFGFVARNVFRVARAFGMKVIVYTRYSKHAAAAIGLKVVGSLEELYEKSDVVSIHVPARGEHIKSVSMDVLKHLKKDGIIVNTARKEVVNEEDLLEFMAERTDVKYLTDVAPDCKDIMQEKYADRYFATPKKAGAQTAEANMNAGVAAAKQIIDFFEEGDISCKVN